MAVAAPKTATELLPHMVDEQFDCNKVRTLVKDMKC